MGSYFLGIGAQKGGTSWLYRCLDLHPDIWLPPVKELHFFNERMRSGSERLPPRLATRRARVELRELVAHLLHRRDPAALGWALRYFLPHRDIAWYRSVLRHRSRPLTGEITPAYATLSDAEVAAIAHELPGVRAILLLRNPLERTYSHAVMDLTRGGRKASTLRTDELIAHVHSRGSLARTAYVETIDRWQRYLGASRLFVGFYDEIAERPVRLLRRVCRFLEVQELDWARLAPVERRVNATRRGRPPAELHQVLAALYRGEIEALARRYGSYAARWLAALPPDVPSP